MLIGGLLLVEVGGAAAELDERICLLERVEGGAFEVADLGPYGGQLLLPPVEPLDPVLLRDPSGKLVVVGLVDLLLDLALVFLVPGQGLLAFRLALGVELFGG